MQYGGGTPMMAPTNGWGTPAYYPGYRYGYNSGQGAVTPGYNATAQYPGYNPNSAYPGYTGNSNSGLENWSAMRSYMATPAGRASGTNETAPTYFAGKQLFPGHPALQTATDNEKQGVISSYAGKQLYQQHVALQTHYNLSDAENLSLQAPPLTPSIRPQGPPGGKDQVDMVSGYGKNEFIAFKPYSGIQPAAPAGGKSTVDLQTGYNTKENEQAVHTGVRVSTAPGGRDQVVMDGHPTGGDPRRKHVPRTPLAPAGGGASSLGLHWDAAAPDYKMSVSKVGPAGGGQDSVGFNGYSDHKNEEDIHTGRRTAGLPGMAHKVDLAGGGSDGYVPGKRISTPAGGSSNITFDSSTPAAGADSGSGDNGFRPSIRVQTAGGQVNRAHLTANGGMMTWDPSANNGSSGGRMITPGYNKNASQMTGASLQSQAAMSTPDYSGRNATPGAMANRPNLTGGAVQFQQSYIPASPGMTAPHMRSSYTISDMGPAQAAGMFAQQPVPAHMQSTLSIGLPGGNSDLSSQLNIPTPMARPPSAQRRASFNGPVVTAGLQTPGTPMQPSGVYASGYYGSQNIWAASPGMLGMQSPQMSMPRR